MWKRRMIKGQALKRLIKESEKNFCKLVCSTLDGSKQKTYLCILNA